MPRTLPFGRSKRSRVGVLVLIAMLAAACSDGSGDDEGLPGADRPVPTGEAPVDGDSTAAAGESADGTVTEPEDQLTGRWTWDDADCEFAEPETVATSCGWLEVPERWDHDDDGDTIRLHVGIFSRGPNDAAPLVYLEGGPGGDPLSNVAFAFEQLFGGLADGRDVVILSQRGTGLSEPALQCDEVLEVDLDLLDEDLATQAELDRSSEAHEMCADRLERAGVDFAAYNSVQSAHDVEALRRALGHDEWDVVGISYGTRLAQTLIREHPDGLRAVVLDSVVPMERAPQTDVPITARRAFEVLFAGCEASPTCGTAYPDLEARWFAMVDRLDVSPAVFEALDPLTGRQYPALVDGEDLMGIGFQALYSQPSFAALPELVALLEQDDTSGLSTFVGVAIANEAFLAIGQYWTVECREEAPFETAADQTAGQTGDERYDRLLPAPAAEQYRASVCDAFAGGDADLIENQPVQSDIPVLVLAGSYDPITPPAGSASVLDGFSQGHFVELPHTGHAVLVQPCGQSIAASFLDDPTSAPDGSCIESIDEPAWAPELFDEVEFTPFSYEADFFSATGVVPVGWEVGFDGTFSRTENALRSSVIVQQTIDGVPAESIIDSIGAIGEGDPEVLETRAVGGRSWEHYGIDVPGSAIDAFVAEDDDRTYLVVLQHAPEDREAAVATLVEPMLEAIAP